MQPTAHAWHAATTVYCHCPLSSPTVTCAASGMSMAEAAAFCSKQHVADVPSAWASMQLDKLAGCDAAVEALQQLR
jgi:hypothetical protein